jgi:hypothetical protein
MTVMADRQLCKQNLAAHVEACKRSLENSSTLALDVRTAIVCCITIVLAVGRLGRILWQMRIATGFHLGCQRLRVAIGFSAAL